VRRVIKRRQAFESLEIYLSKVMVVEGDEMRDIDYEMGILSKGDWRGFNSKKIAEKVPKEVQYVERKFKNPDRTCGKRAIC